MHAHIRALTGCLLLGAGSSAAQDYPNRVVQVVVGETSGSGGDIVMRAMTPKLSETWGQQVIVDNRPGANGIIGAEMVMKAKPDGYTLLAVTPSQMTMNPFVYRKLPYAPLRDFAPIAQITTNHFALVTTPALPATSVAALVKLARSRPDEVLYSSSGVGNQNHLAPEMFARAAGMRIVHVPHKGTAPAIIGAMGGHVQMMLTSLSPVSTYIAGARLRLLATAGLERVAAFPNVPTLVESGYPDVVVRGWSGVVGPIGMPFEIRNKVARDIAAADVRSALSITGRDFTPTSPEAFGAFIKSEMDRWSKVIRAVGLENSQ